MVAGGQFGANGPEDRPQLERCITAYHLQTPSAGFNNYYQIFQTPEIVVILSEAMHILRVIPLDGRSHLVSRIRQWEGDARGWWEGQTLVVETTNFRGKKIFRGVTEQVRMVERFTHFDTDTLEYQLTVSDPATFSTSWTLENALRRADGPLYEFACHEGNYSMTGILAGARAEER